MKSYNIDLATSARVSCIGSAGLPAAINNEIIAEDTGSGNDVWFSSDPAGSVPIGSTKIEWDESESDIEFDVATPSLSRIYLHVGNKPVDYDTIATYPAAWRGVWPQAVDFDDATANGNDATAAGGVSAGGVVGPNGTVSATDYNGSTQYLDVGDITDMDGATAITLKAWINLDSATGAQAIIRKWRASNFGFALMNEGTGRLGLLVSDGTNVINAQSADSLLATGSWIHVAATWSATNSVALYLNGASQSIDNLLQNDAVTSINANAERLGIGARYNGGTEDMFLDGSISRAVIATEAQSAADILDEYRLQGSGASTYITASSRGGLLRRTKYGPGLGLGLLN